MQFLQKSHKILNDIALFNKEQVIFVSELEDKPNIICYYKYFKISPIAFSYTIKSTKTKSQGTGKQSVL